MNVARILYPVKVLGPGNRVGIWLCGCDRACKGCSNPELWQEKNEYEVSVNNVVTLIRHISETHKVDGFTISGGEPMRQAEELSELIERISEISSDILVYSGYKIEELYQLTDPSIRKILSSISVLIDGEYIEELNENLVMRGSSNQILHILNPCYKELYQRYLESTYSQIQNFSTTDGIVSVGIHRKSFNQ